MKHWEGSVDERRTSAFVEAAALAWHPLVAIDFFEGDGDVFRHRSTRGEQSELLPMWVN